MRYFTVLREVTGKKEEALQFPEGTKVTVESVLQTTSNRYGKPFSEYVYDPISGKVRGFLQFFINGQSTSALSEMESELQDGDVLAIVPPVGGG